LASFSLIALKSTKKKKIMNKIKIFIPLFLLFAFVACKSKENTEKRDIQLLTDSTTYNNNASTDSSRTSEANAVPAKRLNESHTATHHTTTSNSNKNKSSASTAPQTSSTSTAGTSTSTTQSTKKKGWSKAAQGAVIGGAAGAVGGAIISKHKGTGAAVGAAVGAAGGYIIGRNKDKKDGR
jgi:hypothetical protein